MITTDIVIHLGFVFLILDNIKMKRKFVAFTAFFLELTNILLKTHYTTFTKVLFALYIVHSIFIFIFIKERRRKLIEEKNSNSDSDSILNK